MQVAAFLAAMSAASSGRPLLHAFAAVHVVYRCACKGRQATPWFGFGGHRHAHVTPHLLGRPALHRRAGTAPAGRLVLCAPRYTAAAAAAAGACCAAATPGTAAVARGRGGGAAAAALVPSLACTRRSCRRPLIQSARGRAPFATRLRRQAEGTPGGSEYALSQLLAGGRVHVYGACMLCS